jgi:hypothetical protein
MLCCVCMMTSGWIDACWLVNWAGLALWYNCFGYLQFFCWGAAYFTYKISLRDFDACHVMFL